MITQYNDRKYKISLDMPLGEMMNVLQDKDEWDTMPPWYPGAICLPALHCRARQAVEAAFYLPCYPQCRY